MTKKLEEQSFNSVPPYLEPLFKDFKKRFIYKSGKLFYKKNGKFYEAGSVHPNGYHIITFQKIHKTRGHWVWFYHYGTFPKRIYRLNKLKLDDRIENLYPRKRKPPKLVEPIATDPVAWACEKMPKEFMFKEENVHIALTLCRICTTRKECLDRVSDISSSYIYGIWGGKVFNLI